MKTIFYASYGSNLNISQMEKRCPNAKVVCTGTVKDYKLTFRGFGVANIEKAKGETVPVAIWEITPNCEKALDRYEGYPTLYIKTDISIITESGENVNAMVYIMAKKYENIPCEPNMYYLNIIKQGYIDNGINLTPLAKAVKQVQREIQALVR